MTAFVIDGSVAVKWLISEAGSDIADTFLTGNFELHVPEFLFVEVGNVLWKAVNRGTVPAEDTPEMMQILLALGLARHSTERLEAFLWEADAFRAKHGRFPGPDSVQMIREDRDR